MGKALEDSGFEEQSEKQGNSTDTIQELLAHLDVGIAQTDMHGNFILVNEQYCRITGYPENELLHKTLMEITHPDDLRKNLPLLQRCITHHEPFTIVKRYIRKDGEVAWVRNRVSSNGKVGEQQVLTAVSLDISAEKEARIALQDSELRYQNFIQRTTEGIWCFEAHEPISIDTPVDRQIDYFFQHAYLTECNDAMARMYGFEKAEMLIGARVGDFFPRDEITQNYFRAFIESGYCLSDTESRETDKDGSIRHFSNNLLGIVDNGLLYRCWGTQRDITAQCLMQDKLMESDRRFRALAETLPQMVWVSDKDGNNEYFSPQWVQYSGINDVVGAWQGMIHPDDRQRSEKMFSEAVKSSIEFSFELRLRDKTGNYRWHQSLAKPVLDASGEVIKWVGSLTDIHDRKMMLDNLEALVMERTTALQESNDHLRQFAHVASHDLKEPVRKVLYFTGLLSDRMKDLTTEDQLKYLGKIEHATKRMRDMIDGVLELSSINGTHLELQPVDIGGILHHVVSDLELPIREKKANVEIGHIPTVYGVSVLLHQLLYNLINNALKFADPARKPLISVTATTIGDFVQVKIKDNGIGFPEDAAETIFKPFLRLHSKDKYEGSGIGLALCRDIVHRLGGTIKATGTPGEGATFIVNLRASEI